jgi:hypothetical protein
MSTWTATLKFAPLLTVARCTDPDWQDAGRTMVTEQTFRFPHLKRAIPLVADHDFGCELGEVADWWRLRWIDGDWLAATAELHAPPPPFLCRGARVSYGCKPLRHRAAIIGGPEDQVLADAIITELTVCASLTPIEPLAEVLSVRQVDPVARRNAAEPEVIHGGGRIVRPGIGQVLEVR